MSVIPLEKYKESIELLPILCVDIVAQNARGEYLLLKRSNEPKKSQWWVVGGRVLKGEKLRDAVVRKMKEETGLVCRNIRPMGYFELVDGVHPFGVPMGYHAVSVIFAAIVDDHQTIKLDNQSEGYKFAKELPTDFNIGSFETEEIL